MPILDYDLITKDGERGWIGEWYSHESDESMKPLDKPFYTQLIDETRLFVSESGSPRGLTRRWTLRLKGYLKPRPYDCQFKFGLSTAGRSKVCLQNVFLDFIE
jgi:beta-glucosidase